MKKRDEGGNPYPCTDEIDISTWEPIVPTVNSKTAKRLLWVTILLPTISLVGRLNAFVERIKWETLEELLITEQEVDAEITEAPTAQSQSIADIKKRIAWLKKESLLAKHFKDVQEKENDELYEKTWM